MNTFLELLAAGDPLCIGLGIDGAERQGTGEQSAGSDRQEWSMSERPVLDS
jgi:hypothetical protein